MIINQIDYDFIIEVPELKSLELNLTKQLSDSSHLITKNKSKFT